MKAKSLGLFLGGMAVGAVAALLLAPESGSDTRQRISSLLAKRKKQAEEEAEDDLQELLDQITADVNADEE